MATKKETAEQKLLRLIETSQSQKSQGAGTPAAAKPPQPVAPLPKAPVAEKTANQEVASKVAQSVQGLGLPLESPKVKEIVKSVKHLGWRAPKINFGLRQVNALMAFVTLGVAIFTGLRLWQEWNFVAKTVQFDTDVKVNRKSESLLPMMKEVAHYLDAIKDRNIFKPYEKKDKVAEKPTGNRKVGSRIESLKLRGISWQDSAQTASIMLEDTSTGVTYFLQQGEQIREVTVKQIFADQVIMSFDGEETALKL